MFKRLKRIIKLSKKDPKALEAFDGLSTEQMKAIPDANEGNGKAVFFGEGTHEEFEEQQKEDKGLKGLFGL